MYFNIKRAIFKPPAVTVRGFLFIPLPGFSLRILNSITKFSDKVPPADYSRFNGSLSSGQSASPSSLYRILPLLRFSHKPLEQEREEIGEGVELAVEAYVAVA